MEISGFHPMSLIDYPGVLSSVVFTQGCDLNCHYCHNKELIEAGLGSISEDMVFQYINKHRDMIDGIVITGGEPTMQKDLHEFILKIRDDSTRARSLKIKLDTNGTHPNLLREVISDINYIALDIKQVLDKNEYFKICGEDVLDLVKDSMNVILESGIDYQFRTTRGYTFMSDADVKQIHKEMEGYNHIFQEVR